MPEEPNRHTRHVIIAISGFLSRDCDMVNDWARLMDYVKKSDVSLFAYVWESCKSRELAYDLGKVSGKAVARHGASVAMRVGRAGVRNALSVGKGIVNVASISPLDLISGGISLVEAGMDVFKGAVKNAKLAGQLLAYTLAMRQPFLT